MSAYYAVYDVTTGALINISTAPAPAVGQAQVAVDGPLTSNEQWSMTLHEKQIIASWYAICNATGSLVSEESPDAPKISDAVLSQLNPPLTRVPISGQLSPSLVWNPSTKTAAAPPASPAAVVVTTQHQVDGSWVDSDAFVKGEQIQISATLQVPGTTDIYTGPGSSNAYIVPLFRGKWGGSAVVPTSDVVALINLVFTDGVAAPVICSIDESCWVVAVPGISSTWLSAPIVKAILAA